jgi:hypothetical protein
VLNVGYPFEADPEPEESDELGSDGNADAEDISTLASGTNFTYHENNTSL